MILPGQQLLLPCCIIARCTEFYIESQPNRFYTFKRCHSWNDELISEYQLRLWADYFPRPLVESVHTLRTPLRTRDAFN
jgi:hypothetical protein